MYSQEGGRHVKAGLVTFFHIHHYGAVLQACATQRAVEQLGGTCEIFNYYVNQNNALSANRFNNRV